MKEETLGVILPQRIKICLLRKARRIRIHQSLNWKTTKFRSKLLEIIDNPYHQLSFYNILSLLTDDSASLFSLRGVKRLIITAHDEPILHQIKEKAFSSRSYTLMGVRFILLMLFLPWNYSPFRAAT